MVLGGGTKTPFLDTCCALAGGPLDAVKQMENINKFVTSATEEFGIEMFEVDDLFEDLDMLRVMACIAELRGTTERCIPRTTP